MKHIAPLIGAIGLSLGASQAFAGEKFEAPLPYEYRLGSPELQAKCLETKNRTGILMADGSNPCDYPSVDQSRNTQRNQHTSGRTEYSLDNGVTWNIYTVGGGVGLLALIAGGALWRFNKKRKEKQWSDGQGTDFLESRISQDSFFGNSKQGKDFPGEGSGDVGSYSLSQLDAIGDVDPVAEADVYMAYGRDLQAEEILKDAMEHTPGRVGIYTKLLEIYNKRADKESFEALFKHMVGTFNFGTPSTIVEDMKKLGRKIDSENPLYAPFVPSVEEPVGVPEAPTGDGDLDPNLSAPTEGADTSTLPVAEEQGTNTLPPPKGPNEERWALNDNIKNGADKALFITQAIPGDTLRMHNYGSLVKLSDGSWEHINGSVKKHYTTEGLLALPISKGSGRGRKDFIVDAFGKIEGSVRRGSIDESYLGRTYTAMKKSGEPMRVMLQDKESGVTTDWLVVNRDRTKYTLQDAGDSNKIIVLTAKDLVRMVNEVLSNPQPSEVTLPIGSEDVLPTGNEDLEPPAGTVGTVASEVVGSITSIVESHHIEPITIKQFESQFGEDGKPVNEPVLVPPVMDRSLGAWSVIKENIPFTTIEERVMTGEHSGKYRYTSIWTGTPEVKYIEAKDLVHFVNIYIRESNEYYARKTAPTSPYPAEAELAEGFSSEKPLPSPAVSLLVGDEGTIRQRLRPRPFDRKAVHNADFRFNKGNIESSILQLLEKHCTIEETESELIIIPNGQIILTRVVDDAIVHIMKGGIEDRITLSVEKLSRVSMTIEEKKRVIKIESTDGVERIQIDII